MTARPRTIIARLALALALSAVLAGSAQAAERQENRAGVRGTGSVTTDTSDVFTRAVGRDRAARTVRPDDRPGLRDVGSTSIIVSDVFERSVLRHNAVSASRPDDRAGLHGAGTEIADNASITATVSAGFHWADAGFGAAAAIALVLVLVLGGLAVARANQSRSHAIVD